MDFVELGKTGEKLPVIGIGTWKLGADRQGTVEVIRRGIDLGMNFVDTAEMYGNEEIVGEGIKGLKPFLATKVSPSHFKEKAVIDACNMSLTKLGVKCVDLYQLHWPNYNVNIKETMRAMESLVDQGKIRHIGVSNFSVQEFEEAQASMKKYEIVSNQIEYSVLVRNVGDAFFDYAKKNKVTILAYSPFGTGALFDERFSEPNVILEDIGKKYNKSVAQVSLNWLIAKGNISTIPKSSTLTHMEDNLGGIGWKLSKEDMEKIDAVGQAKAPLSGRINGFTKRTAPIWSGLMTHLEKRRIGGKLDKKPAEEKTN